MNLDRRCQIIKYRVNRWWGYKVIYKGFDLKTKKGSYPMPLVT
jgi:hypothetical protein